jgi:hypothetical protein
MTCSICFDSFNRSSRVVSKCPFCALETCRSCLQTYLLNDVSDTPRCINPTCGHGYSREFLDGELTQTFRLKTYKVHREKVLSDRERSRFPSTQDDVRAYVVSKTRASAISKEIATLHAHMSELREELMCIRTHIVNGLPVYDHRKALQILDQYKPIHKQLRMLRRELKQMRRIVGSYGRPSNVKAVQDTTRQEFIKPCPSDQCKGFLSTSWKCGLCDLWSCPTCHDVKGDSRDSEHTCDPNKVLTIQFLSKEAKSCPKCGVQICKIEGCDQMWCTSCNTGFNWRTGKLANGPIHNPHYFEWLLTRGEARPNDTHLHLGNCDFETDHAVTDVLSGTTDATERYLLQTWQLMRELQDVQGHRTHILADEKYRQFRVRYMANEMTEATWKITLQRYEKDANFHLANDNVRDVFVAASRDLIRQILEPGQDISAVSEQVVALFTYCNAASDVVSKRFMRRARTYAVRMQTHPD